MAEGSDALVNTFSQVKNNLKTLGFKEEEAIVLNLFVLSAFVLSVLKVSADYFNGVEVAIGSVNLNLKNQKLVFENDKYKLEIKLKVKK